MQWKIGLLLSVPICSHSILHWHNLLEKTARFHADLWVSLSYVVLFKWMETRDPNMSGKSRGNMSHYYIVSLLLTNRSECDNLSWSTNINKHNFNLIKWMAIYSGKQHFQAIIYCSDYAIDWTMIAFQCGMTVPFWLKWNTMQQGITCFSLER